MIISNMTVRKMRRGDPKFPAPAQPPQPPFTDVYLLVVETDEGPQECPIFVNGYLSPGEVANILRAFAAAVDRMDQKKAA